MAYIAGGGLASHFRREGGAAIGREATVESLGASLAPGSVHWAEATPSHPRHLLPPPKQSGSPAPRSPSFSGAVLRVTGWLAWSPPAPGTSLSQQTALANPTQLNPKHTRLSLLVRLSPPHRQNNHSSIFPTQPSFPSKPNHSADSLTTSITFLACKPLALGTSFLRVHFAAPLACTAPLSSLPLPLPPISKLSS